MSRLLVTISRDTVVEMTTAPRIKTRMRMVQTNVEKNVPNDVDSALVTANELTSRRAFPNRNTNVVAVTTLVKENRVRVVLNGRLLRSFDA
jgi:ATP phosphoribosyltransferase